jgi:E1A-binding protein p400
VEKLVEYKQQNALEKKRKQALDQHLNFIIGQTEQYTQLVTEGIQGKTSNAPSVAEDSVETSTALGSDGDFDPDKASDEDDEETIDREEKEDPDKLDPDDEIAMLNRESDLPLQQVLPKEVLDVIPASSLPSTSTGTSRLMKKRKIEEVDVDTDFNVEGQEEEDDEETIAEQEAKESAGYAEELRDLENEANMTQEELLKKYAAAYQDYPGEVDSEETGDETMSQDDSQEEETEEEEDLTKDDDEEEEEIGLESLINLKSDDATTSEHNVSIALPSFIDAIAISV